MPRLPTSTNTFDLASLRNGLKPFRLHWFPRLRSTNDHAALLRERGTLYAPSIVLTGHQLAGRGRGAHRWWSAAGCLTVTFVLPTDDAIAPHQVPLIAGMAVRRVAERLTWSTGIQLKWPNDLLFQGRKLGGLLCERVRKVDLIGLGLNVNVDPADAPEDIKTGLTSLWEIARQLRGQSQAGRPGAPYLAPRGVPPIEDHGQRSTSAQGTRRIESTGTIDMTDAVIYLAKELWQMMRHRTQHPFASMLKEYDEHHALIGRRVSVLDVGDGRAVNGKCEGLDEVGRLLVRTRGGKLHPVIAGQVLVKGPRT